jgi:predicted phosphate transport protein (TIGR00153 family)
VTAPPDPPPASSDMRLSSVIAPRDHEFFDLFEEAGGNILRAAGLLEEMLLDYPEKNEIARDILICEQEGDRITHDIIRRLNQTFVTPIDREDIYALASALDDIVDFTEEVADYLGLYRIEAPFEQSQRMARVLHQAARQIDQALPRLRGFQDISHFTVEINRLENDGDRIVREAMAALFDDGIDPMVVIRWKDIYERLENAIDATERAANILEGITIKNS